MPSNMMLTRFGARRWIAVIMSTWGVLSCALAFVHGPISYVSVRCLIGAAEAGFFPGMILYLTAWFPGPERAGLLALFTLSIPVSNIVGAPLSVWILSLGGRGHLHGWQWLFLLEGVPAILLGLVLPFVLKDGPADVNWLSQDERRRLLVSISDDVNRLGALHETEASNKPRRFTSLPREVLPAGVVYFCLMVGLYALGFWVPRIISGHDVKLSQLGWLTAIPYGAGGVGMLLCTVGAGRVGQRTMLAAAFFVACAGMSRAGLSRSWPAALAGLSVAVIGVLSGMPLFWADFSQRVTPAQSGNAIAAINSLGNLGGFFGPYAIGLLLEQTHSLLSGLMLTAAILLCGSILLVARRPRTQVGGLA